MNPDPEDSDAARIVDVRVVLPDHWWRIPLKSAQARERSVDRLVERQFAGIDDQPQLRTDTRKQLLKHAEDVADVDGHLLALSLLEIQGVPVPASLVLHWINMPAEPGAVPVGGELLLDLQGELQPAAEPEPGFRLDLARVAAGSVLRRVYESTADLEGTEPVPSLVADYWVERPDGTGLVYLTFSSPVVALRQALLDLFDAVVSALYWVRADEQAKIQPYGRAARGEEQS